MQPAEELTETESTPPGPKEPGSLSNLWYTARPLLLIGLLLFLSFYTNEAVISYRMEEFNRAMASLSQKYNQSHSLNMLARFELIRQRKDMPEEDEAALELRLRSLASAKLVDTAGAQMRRHVWRDRVIGTVIGAVRWVLGKKTEVIEVSTQTRQELEVGYFYEQARKYDKAIAVYGRVLEADESVGEELAATLLLHRGFCLSLLSEYGRAKADFQRVADLLPGSEDNRAAIRFLEIIHGLEEELRLAKAANQGPLAYGRQLLRLANYTGALEELGKALSQPGLSKNDRFEGRFLYARAQEEVGFDSEAVLTYRSLIEDAPQSPFARKASRRLYLLGKVYVNDKDLEKEALKKIEQYQDMKFIDNLKNFALAPLPQTESAKRSGELAGLAANPSPLSTEGLENATGTPLEAAPLPEAVKPRDEDASLQSQKLANALKAEQQAKRANARRIQADPMRREAILQVLTSNKGELEFLYQKWLRKGAAFEGELSVRLLISPTGGVREAKVVAGKSSISHAGFIADVLQNLRRWKFREDPGAQGDLPVTFPLKFVNKQ